MTETITKISLRRLLGAFILASFMPVFASGQVPNAGLRLWLSADRLPESTVAVGSWEDARGTGPVAVQSDSQHQPVRRTEPGALNGHPTVHFDGSSLLNLPDGTVPDGNSAYTVTAVIRPDTSPSSEFAAYRLDQAFLWSGVTSGGQANWFFFCADGSVQNDWWFDQATTGPAVLRYGSGRSYVLTFTYDPAVAGRSIYVNSAQKGSRVTGATRHSSPLYNRIGGGLNGPDYFYGDIAEMLVYDHALSRDDQQSLEGYLLDKYGISPWPTSGEPRVWLRADQGAEFTAAGRLQWWDDQSGNDNSALQWYPGRNATWIPDAINGKPAVRFNGTADYLDLPDSTVPPGNSPYTMLAVLRPLGTNNSGASFLGAGNTSGGEANWFTLGPDGRFYNAWWFDDAVTGTGAITLGEPVLLSVVYDTTQGRSLYVSGHIEGRSTSILRNGGIRNNRLGAWINGADYFNGDIAEVIVYGRALSDAERVTAECRLASKYAIPGCTAQPPLITIPAFMTVEATGSSGTAVTFTATATNTAGSSVAVACNPTSGSVFPLGTTSVTCTAMDDVLQASSTFPVNVVDTTPPSLLLPAGLLVDAATANGAVVSFITTGSDLVDGAVSVSCWPSSGSLFPIGSTWVSCSASDRAGNVATGQFSVTVRTTPPVMTGVSGPTGPVSVNATATISATFVDEGHNDVHTAVVDWGDGTVEPCTISESNGSGTANCSHPYSTAGVYTVGVSVTDNTSLSTAGSYRYIVVFDPDGGFVTGGGWINSPVGAYVADSTLTGKATFGFVSKYQKGATVPSGQTQFQFHAASFDFTSTAYDWLVVSGAKAQYKGTGSVNGSGATYSFLLTATDGDVSGGGGIDKFRMKIWIKETGTTVYDNVLGGSNDIDAANPQTLGGGSILVHK
jgi:Concanavalin A-like lectin/glucanases superfamily/HYR domain/PKD domain